MSIKDNILGLNDLVTKEVKVPQWKTTLTVRELGLAESMTAYSAMEAGDDSKVTIKHEDIATMVAYGVIDPDTGERVFSDDDIEALSHKNSAALMLLYTAIVGLSGTVEEATKN